MGRIKQLLVDTDAEGVAIPDEVFEDAIIDEAKQIIAGRKGEQESNECV